MLPYPDPRGEQPSWDEGHTLFITEQMAVDRLNAHEDILPGYNLTLVRSDSGCNIQSKATLSLINDTLNSNEKPIVGMVGPGCSASASTIGSLSGRDRIALINVHIAGSLRLANRNAYPFSFGTLDSTEVFVKTLMQLIEDMKWSRISALYDESRLYYYSTAQLMEQRIRERNTAAAAVSSKSKLKYFFSAVYNTHIPLNAIKNEYRVIILFVGPDFLSRILCLALKLRMMHPVYQFIIVSRVADEINTVPFVYDREEISCSEEEIRQHITNILVVHYQLKPLDESKLTDSGLSYGEFLNQYHQKINDFSTEHNLTIRPSFWAASFFDAAWSLGLALNSSMADVNLSEYRFGHFERSKVIRERLLELTFEGVSGTIRFDNKTGYSRRNVALYRISASREMGNIGFYDQLTGNINIANPSESFIKSYFENVTVVITAPKGLAPPVLIVTATSFVLVLVLQILTIHYRNSTSVKASSPRLSQLAFLGCYIQVLGSVTNVCADVYTDQFSPEANCVLWHLLNIAAAIGTTLIFGTICAKTWRLYRIFVHFKDPGKLLSERVLITMVTISVVINIIISITWVAVDRFKPFYPESEREVTEVREENVTTNIRIVNKVIYACSQQNFLLWCFILLIFNTIFVGGAVVLAFLTRHIPYSNFKSRGIMGLSYILTGILGLGFSLYTILLTQHSYSNIVFRFLVVSLLLNCYVYLSCFLLFLPPVYPVIKLKLEMLHAELVKKRH
jgi:gamma-aminobutyric acid type B receptor